jgi:DNA polymerase elongation subunit (family B)
MTNEKEAIKLDIRPYEWFKKDDLNENNHTIGAWGLDRDSKPYLIRFANFKPSLVIQLPQYVNKTPKIWQVADVKDVYDIIKKRLGDDLIDDVFIAKKASVLYGYTENKYPILQMWFNTEQAMMKCKNLLKQPLLVYDKYEAMEIPCSVWEDNISSILQFITLARIKHCKWFRTTARKVRADDKISTLENEYIVNCENMKSFPAGYTSDQLYPIIKYDQMGIIKEKPAFPITSIPDQECKSWVVNPGFLVIDIETYSDNPKAMPVKTITSHVAYMISCIYQRVGKPETRKRYVIIMGDCAKLPKASEDVIVIKVLDEYELCEALTQVIHDHDPEVISGYNILGFDYPYLDQRMQNMVKEWNVRASRLLGVNPKLIIPKKWSSKGYGHNENYFIDFPGRISVDLLPIIRRGHKLAKYDLNTVSLKFVKRGKHDIKAPEMFKIYEELSKYKKLFEKCIRTWVAPNNLDKALSILNKANKAANEKIIDYKLDLTQKHEDRLYFVDMNIPALYPTSCDGLIPIYHKNVIPEVIKEVVEGYEKSKGDMMRVALYCVEDSELVIDIIDKNNTWISLVELSNIVTVSIVDVFSRGQQIRGLAQLYYMLKPLGVVIDFKPPSSDSKFSGGFVGEPKPGLYDYVMCLDFASLYPSIIQAYNICHHTFVKPTDNISPDKCHIIPCDVLDKDGNIIGKTHHRFVKKEVFEGYIPRLVGNLVAERRKITKVEIINEIEGSLQWIILNERQLAIKVCANSIYGLLGVREGGLIPLLEGAESVTSIGREKIQFCNKYLEDKYNATIIYNDTDSTFFTIPGINNYKDGIIMMNKLAKELSDTMQKPMYLEAEKIGRMLAIKKKKYAFWNADIDEMVWKDNIKGGVKIINENYGKLKDYNKDRYYILVKGIILARRDNFKFLRDVYWEMLTMILERKPFNDVLKVLIKNCLTLYKNKVHWSDLIIIRQLGAHYKSDNFFMKVFGEEIKKLGRPANPGDRLEYLIVKDNGNGGLLGQRLRLPEVYNERKGTKDNEEIDTLYYLEKLFIKSIEQLWQVGYNKELEVLDLKYRIEDAYKMLDKTQVSCKNERKNTKEAYGYVEGIFKHFSYDYLKILDYFENVMPVKAEENQVIKFVFNKFKKARCEFVSGRDVFNPKITALPIKMMVKAINIGKLDEYIQAITPPESVN